MNELALARRCAEEMWAGDKASQALGMQIEITAAGAATATCRCAMTWLTV